MTQPPDSDSFRVVINNDYPGKEYSVPKGELKKLAMHIEKSRIETVLNEVLKKASTENLSKATIKRELEEYVEAFENLYKLHIGWKDIARLESEEIYGPYKELIKHTRIKYKLHKEVST